MYHYMICCKLKLNLHGNNKLCMYWTYTLLSWFIFQNFLEIYFQIESVYLFTQNNSSYITIDVLKKIHIYI